MAVFAARNRMRAPASERFVANSMSTRQQKTFILLGLILVIGLAHAADYQASEPFFNNDETRHVMTGVYFRDVIHDLPVPNLRDYTIKYFLQYPALGLMIWPPFFYVVEGVLMSVFGTSMMVAKGLVGFFAALACVYLFRLVCWSHDVGRAAVAVLIFGFGPIVFDFSRYVMLEVPTLALALAATFYFIRYLDLQQRRDLVCAALASALAALTRFDAVYLGPLFAILLIARKRLNLLWRRDVITVAALALLLVLPFYALTAMGVGWVHVKYATEHSSNYPNFLSLERLFFYPATVPRQISWWALIPAMVGLAFSLTAMRRRASRPYLATIIATYLTFTPLGEVEPRHAIYWIPALALFAADGLMLAANHLRAPRLYLPLATLALAGIAWSALARPYLFVRGYEDAARYVLTNSENSPYCLFVGRLNGDLIYQLRRHDPNRRLWLLRADKLLFSILIKPDAEYRQFAVGDQDILDAIYKYDPEFIVVEEPPELKSNADSIPIPIEEQMRAASEEHIRTVINNHPERFQLEKIIAVNSNDPVFRGMQLKLFRNTFHNQHPERRLDVEILMLRRSVQTVVP